MSMKIKSDKEIYEPIFQSYINKEGSKAQNFINEFNEYVGFHESGSFNWRSPKLRTLSPSNLQKIYNDLTQLGFDSIDKTDYVDFERYERSVDNLFRTGNGLNSQVVKDDAITRAYENARTNMKIVPVKDVKIELEIPQYQKDMQSSGIFLSTFGPAGNILTAYTGLKQVSRTLNGIEDSKEVPSFNGLDTVDYLADGFKTGLGAVVDFVGDDVDIILNGSDGDGGIIGESSKIVSNFLGINPTILKYSLLCVGGLIVYKEIKDTLKYPLYGDCTHDFIFKITLLLLS